MGDWYIIHSDYGYIVRDFHAGFTNCFHDADCHGVVAGDDQFGQAVLFIGFHEQLVTSAAFGVSGVKVNIFAVKKLFIFKEFDEGSVSFLAEVGPVVCIVFQPPEKPYFGKSLL